MITAPTTPVLVVPFSADQSIKNRAFVWGFEIPSRDSLYPTSWTTFFHCLLGNKTLFSGASSLDTDRHSERHQTVLSVLVGRGCEHSPVHCVIAKIWFFVVRKEWWWFSCLNNLLGGTRASDAEVLICIAVPHLLSRTYNFGFVLFIDSGQRYPFGIRMGSVRSSASTCEDEAPTHVLSSIKRRIFNIAMFYQRRWNGGRWCLNPERRYVTYIE